MAQTLKVEYSTDPADDASPSWTDVSTYARAFSTSRGRTDVRSRVEAGTATILLNNRTRLFDPSANPLIRPNNRWRLTETGSGEVMFLGYAAAYTLGWQSKSGVDATVTVSLVDETRMLALDRLPVTDPPRDTYDDLVMFDVPTGFWPINSAPDFETILKATVGSDLLSNAFGGASAVTETLGAIVGEPIGAYLALTGTQAVQTGVLTYAMSGDAGGLSEFTIETWLAVDGTPSSTELLISGPQGIPSHTYTWKLSLDTAGKLVFQVKNSAGTVHTCTAFSALTQAPVFPASSAVWYHVVATISSGALRLYQNGSTAAVPVAFTGTIEGLDNGYTMIVGNAGTTIGSNDRAFDKIAFYRTAMTAARVTAHYNAGRLRGFARGDLPGDVFTDVVAAAGSTAAVSARTGSREMVGIYMTGQPPLDILRRCEDADNVDAFMFIAKDGTITFLDDGHRAVSPWNTIQATFTDDGSGMGYTDIEIAYDDTFVANDIRVTREGATTQTATDSASISFNGPRPLPLDSVPITQDDDAFTMATGLLEKFIDPYYRIQGLTVLTYPNATRNAVLGLELGDRIRVIRSTIPTSGYLFPATTLYPATSLYPDTGPIVQELFVQKIDITGVPGRPWEVRLGVSPL